MLIKDEYVDYDKLRIAQCLDNPFVNIKNIDFTIIGLKKEIPIFTRGRKVSAEYCNEADEVVVKKSFSDLSDGVQILFEWFNEDGTVGLSKTEDVHMNTQQHGEFLKRRRERQVAGLVEGAVGTPAEPLVTAIFNHYATETVAYKELGDTALQEAIEDETDPTILAYLGIEVDPETGDTIMDRILYQIVGEVLVP